MREQHLPDRSLVSDEEVELAAVAIFRFDYPADKWSRFGQKDYHPERYRAKAHAALLAVRVGVQAASAA